MTTTTHKPLRAPQLVPTIVAALLAVVSLGPIPGCP